MPVGAQLIQRALTGQLIERADPDRARRQQAYMKSDMPFFGVHTPTLRSITRAVFRAHPAPTESEWRAIVLHLWRTARHREMRYAAIELASQAEYRRWLGPAALPMLEEMVVTGAWWDYVDQIAAHLIGHVLKGAPAEVVPLLYRWASDDNLWKRRTAILAQLRFKADTDVALLTYAIEQSMDSPEFFLRKAIGWALREFGKTDPEAVRRFVARREARLSSLSRREALRLLDRSPG